MRSVSEPDVVRTGCCIVGGGPAGMMAGFLLARAGIRVLVLEKHGDFLRDFRGDTVHPSTMQVMHDVGLLEAFLRRPHQEARTLSADIGGTTVRLADFSHLPTAARFMALMPQWEFLDVLRDAGQRFPEFEVRLNTEATGLMRAPDGRATGVDVQTPDVPLRVEADLVIGADGRASVMRAQAGLAIEDRGAPMDVLWMRLPRHADDPEAPLGHVRAGTIVITIPRGDYYQCGYVVPKGGVEALRAGGLDAFRSALGRAAPVLRGRTDALASWGDVKVLTVRVDRLRRWAVPGLLCIGDAAHAMSPIGGVGINLAIQDAVAAANLLHAPLAAGAPTLADLDAVQARRQPATDAVQRAQLLTQNRIIRPVLDAARPVRVPWVLRLFEWIPLLRRIPARLIGMGLRMERVTSPDVHVPRSVQMDAPALHTRS